jgi:hypothetical protein
VSFGLRDELDQAAHEVERFCAGRQLWPQQSHALFGFSSALQPSRRAQERGAGRLVFDSNEHVRVCEHASETERRLDAHLDRDQAAHCAARLHEHAHLVRRIRAERQASERHGSEPATAQASQSALQQALQIAAGHERQFPSAARQEHRQE